jgi:hypothetical protein
MNPDFMSQMGGKGSSSFGEEFLGPDYNYYDYIKLPGEMGMSEAGNFKALADNIAGVLNYANVLISGRGAAKRGSADLGSKFFINTGGKCKPAKYKGKDKDDNDEFKETGEEAERYVYIDNTVQGKFLGEENKGLVPGMIENVVEMNPLDIMSAFTQEAVPYCKKISRSTMPDKGTKTHHVAFGDMERDTWKEGFKTLLNELENMKNDKGEIEIPNDLLIRYPLLNVLTSSVSVILLVLVVYLMKKY